MLNYNCLQIMPIEQPLSQNAKLSNKYEPLLIY